MIVFGIVSVIILVLLFAVLFVRALKQDNKNERAHVKWRKNQQVMLEEYRRECIVSKWTA